LAAVRRSRTATCRSDLSIDCFRLLFALYSGALAFEDSTHARKGVVRFYDGAPLFAQLAMLRC
jgi:hypothetical protein